MFLLKDYKDLLLTVCVKILYNSIKNVENQIGGIHSKTEEIKMIQIKSEQHLWI